MQVARPAGRHAAVRKYDILSALMAHALTGDKHRQRQVMRFMALITSRYNWRRNELSIAQTEIAKLWSVDERTVKREVAKLRACGWLVLKRAAARGRTAVHEIDMGKLLADTEDDWHRVGPDLVERLSPEPTPETPSNVVPLHSVVPPPGCGESAWARAQAMLHARDPHLFSTWFRQLTEADRDAGRVTLAAPSRFHANYVQTHLGQQVLVALRKADPSVTDVRVEG